MCLCLGHLYRAQDDRAGGLCVYKVLVLLPARTPWGKRGAVTCPLLPLQEGVWIYVKRETVLFNFSGYWRGEWLSSFYFLLLRFLGPIQ